MVKFNIVDSGVGTILGPGPTGINYCYWPNPGGGYETPVVTDWNTTISVPSEQSETPREILAAEDLLAGVEKWIDADRPDVAAFMWRALSQYADKMASQLEG